MSDRTVSFIDHYAAGLASDNIFWGTINGVPIYAPYGARVVTLEVSSTWLKAHPPKDLPKAETK